MRISKKIITIFIVGMMVAALFSVTNTIIVNFEMKKSETSVKNEIVESIDVDTQDKIKELAETIGSYEISYEEAIDRDMLTAANLLYEKDVDSDFSLTDADLERLLTLTGMSDLYISDKDGIFTQTTEEAGKGMCLFDIWDGYKQLVTGESDYLPSSMKIKEETGEIFKFTAIPRKDRQGTLQSALNADRIQEDLQQFVKSSNGIRSMYFIDPYNTVLTENLADGAQSVYTKGSTVTNDFVAEIINGSKDIHIETADGFADVYAPVFENNSLKYVIAMNVDLSGYYAAANMIETPFTQMIKKITTISVGQVAVVIVLAVIMLVIAAKLLLRIFRPIKGITVMTADLSNGKLDTPDITANGNDEISDVAGSLNTMKHELTSYIKSISERLGKMANGDFRQAENNEFKGDFSEIGQSLNDISAGMTEMINKIRETSEKVTDGSAAISASAKSVADNAYNQVQEVEVLSERIKAISDKIERNADDAANALEYSEKAGTKINDQNIAIGQMKDAMHEIEQRSNEISTVIRTIEDMAFQTNILALNAAIEASRAGEAGKGFSVVADEVRNLANKSSEAASNTSKLIEATVESVNAGVETAGNVAEVMNEVMELSEKVNSAVKSISEATESQSGDIKEVRGSIENISEVIHSNSAASEESASGCAELSQEADVLRAQISDFTI